MGVDVGSSELFAAMADCDVVIADSKELKDECFRVRYQVYCLEQGHSIGANGIETDNYDRHARHVLLIHRASGQAVGTVRVIPSTNADGLDSLPMARICPAVTMNKLKNRLGGKQVAVGEISRFAVSRDRRFSLGASPFVRLALLQGVVRLSGELGLTDWCALMEPVLLRLHRTTGIHFDPIDSFNPLVECHGKRQPSHGGIAAVLTRIRDEKPKVWEYITLAGSLWPPGRQIRAVERRHQDSAILEEAFA